MLINSFFRAGYTKQVPVTFEVAPDVCDEIITDEEWLWQMLLNLLTNACKYTDKGSITVRVSICEDSGLAPEVHRMQHTASWGLSSLLPKLSTTNSNHKDTLMCEVIDTGIGVDPHKIATMFDAFSQMQEGQVTGTGLGLFGVRTRAEGLLGSCGARHNTESSTGTGTVLWFAIPYTPDNCNLYSESPDSPFARIRSTSTSEPRSVFKMSSKLSNCSLVTMSSFTVSDFQFTSSSQNLTAKVHSTVKPTTAVQTATEQLIRRLKLTAIVIEDTISVRKLMQRLLLQMGFESVVCYENGSKGLDALMAGTVDIVFSDVQMPILTGPEVGMNSVKSSFYLYL